MGDQTPSASSSAYGAAPTGWSVPPDLATQLEDLIRTVWESEENWRFDDRLDLASGQEGEHPS
ncbi:MAG: hypothetical protein J2P40_01120 [Candidatus Dormibacteraeota bacterium]|nr:hypothetical protein [Candidatus Dormibacteraeota bacterium]MBO0759849.1 hypothetical protein [Candidatus Dormibacteraeota bacterium]